MKFDALRSSVARLFETAATLVSPKTGAMPDPYAPVDAVKLVSGRDLRAPGPVPEPKYNLVAGKVTPDGFKPLSEPFVSLDPERAVAADAKAAEIQKAIRDAMPGADVHVKVIGTGEDVTAKILQDIVDQAKREGIKPPPDSAYPWSTWTGQMAAEGLHAPPGWSFCRIGNRKCAQSGKPEDDTVEFVFGLVRGSFGIFRRPFDVCEFNPGPELKESNRILTCVTHLQSGIGMGLFANMELAAEACELIDRSGFDWGSVNPNNAETWMAPFNRIVSIWKGAGIHVAALMHAHVTGSDGDESPPICIFERTAESMNYGRPDKLS